MKKIYILFLMLAASMALVNAQGTWTRKADFIGAARFRAVRFTINDQIYYGTGNVISGSPESADFYKYDIASDTWIPVANLPKGMQAGIGFSVGGKGYAGIGWLNGNGFSDLYEYDTSLNSWVPKASWPGPLTNDANSFVLNGMAYVGGGDGPYGNPTISNFYQFDPVANSWVQKANIPIPGRRNAGTFTIGNYGYLGGGGNDDLLQVLDDYYRYDPVNNQWTPIVDFPIAAESRNCGFAFDGDGYSTASQLLNKIYKYNLFANQWSLISVPPYINFSADMSEVVGNKVYFLRTSTNEFWEWDPNGISSCLVAHYPFTGNAADSSITGNNAAVNGATLTTDRFGNSNSAYAFNGLGDYIDAGDVTYLDGLSEATWNWWMSTNDPLPRGAGNDYVSVFRKDSSWIPMQFANDGYDYWRSLLFTGGAGSANLIWGLGNSGVVSYLGDWAMYTVVKTFSELKYYRNGVLQQSIPYTGILENKNAHLLFGRAYTDNTLESYNGKLDDIRIYSCAISEEEITTLFNDCSAMAAFDLPDTLSECGNAISLDAGANYSSYSWNTGSTSQILEVFNSGMYRCTVTQGSCSVTDSVYVNIINANILQNDTTICLGASLNLCSNNALFLSGTPNPGLGGYATVSNISSILPTGSAKTYECAFRLNQSVPSGNNMGLWAFGPDPLQDCKAFGLKISSSQCGSNKLWLWGHNCPEFCGPTVQINHDYKCVVVVSGNNVKLYLDGVLEMDVTMNLAGVISDNYFIGLGWDSYNFQGYIDDVRIWDFPWTQSDVTSAYNSCIYPNNSNLISGWDFNQATLNEVVNIKSNIDDIDFNVNCSLEAYSSSTNCVSAGTYSFLWSDGSTTSSISVTPTQTTTYYLTVSNGSFSCTDSVIVTVSNTSADFFVEDSISVCGDSTILDAGSGFSSYLWNTGASSQTLSVYNTDWYKCTVNQSSCSSTDSVFVSLFNSNIIQNDTTICNGSSIVLTGEAPTANILSNCALSDLPASLQQNLVAWYPFCGNANDVSSVGNDAISNGAVLSNDYNGNSQSAYQFDGTSSRISAPDNSAIDIYGSQQASTISFWFKIDDADSTYNFIHRGYVSANPSLGNNYLAVEYHGVNQVHARRLIFTLYNFSTLNDVYSLPNLIEENKWYNVTVVRNQTSAIFLNGVNVSETVINNGWTTNYNSSVSLTGINFGAQSGRSSVSTFFYLFHLKGAMDNVMLFDRALSASEIMDLYGVQNLSYSWSTGETASSIEVTPTQTTTYYLTVSNDSYSCTDSVEVTVNNISTNLFVQDSISVCGDSTILDAGSGFDSYLWSTGATTQTLTVNNSGWYKCIANQNSCTSNDSVFVSLIHANITQNDTTILGGNTVNLYVETLSSQFAGQFTLITNLGDSSYYISNDPYSWFDAHDLANTYSGHLATLTSYREDTAVSNRIRFMFTNGLFPLSQNTTNGECYFGLFQNTNSAAFSEPNGGWEWVTGEPFSYSGWYPGEPNNNSLNSEYGSINWQNTSRWNDLAPGNGGVNSVPYQFVYEQSNDNATVLWSTGETTPNISVNPCETTTYYVTVSNGIGSCIDSVTVIVSPTIPSITEATICQGQTYLFDGVNYSVSGTYSATLSNANGCDSIATLILQVDEAHGSLTTLSACESYSWNGQTYTQSGSYYYSVPLSNGCDSVATLDLTINHESSSSSLITSCGDYTWNGQTYSSSGTYQYNSINTSGCDSTATLNLTINTFGGITQNDTTILGGNTVNLYVETLPTQFIGQFTLITSLDDSSYYISNDPYSWFDANDLANTYSGHLATLTSYREDTAVSNRIRFMFTNGLFPLNQNTTNGECYFGLFQNTNSAAYSEPNGGWEWVTGEPFSYSGWYPGEPNNNSLNSEYGSINWQNTSRWNDLAPGNGGVNSVPYQFVYEQSNDNATVLWSTGETTPNISVNPCETTTYYVTVSNGIGSCIDSVTVTVSPTIPSITEASVCQGQTYLFNGVNYSVEGTYSATLSNANGCDSIVTLVLDVKETSSSLTTISECGSYTWNGQTYSSSGSYNFNSTNSAGCDSTATLNLTINTLSVAANSINASATVITSGTSVTLSVNGGSLGTSANWKWYSGSCGGVLVGTGTSVTVSPTSTTTYFVQAQGICNTTTCVSVIITVNSVLCGPTGITSNALNNTICSGSSVTLTVQGVLVSGASWKWYKGGCGSHSSIGSGTSIVVSPTRTTTYYVRSQGGSCGTSSCVSITINVSSRPSMPGSITGISSGLCNRTGVVYSVSSVSGATSYVWSVPVGATIASGQGTNSIVVNYGTTLGTNGSCGSRSICVKAVNACGNSALRCISISLIPTISCSISGPSTVCRNQVVTYSITASTNASSYSWIVPSGWTILSGQGTLSISVRVGNTSGTISVTASNACGVSSAASKYVTKRNCSREEDDDSVLIHEISLYPNPVSGHLFLDAGGYQAERIEIFDVLGNVLDRMEWKNEIDLSGYQSGLYFIRIYTDDSVILKRIEVAH